jgi:hypothetical protein
MLPPGKLLEQLLAVHTHLDGAARAVEDVDCLPGLGLIYYDLTVAHLCKATHRRAGRQAKRQEENTIRWRWDRQR